MIITSTHSDRTTALNTIVILNKTNNKNNRYVNSDGTISSYTAAEEQRESNAEYMS